MTADMEFQRGPFHWRAWLATLSWPPSGLFTTQLGLEEHEGDDLTSRARNAIGVVESAMGTAETTTLPSATQSSIERAVNEALACFTPEQQRVVLDLGNRSQKDEARAFVWETALQRIDRSIASSSSPGSISLFSEWPQIKRLLDEQRGVRTELRRATQLDPTLGKIKYAKEADSFLLAVLRMTWFDRLIRQVATWPAADVTSLRSLVEVELQSLSLADRM